MARRRTRRSSSRRRAGQVLPALPASRLVGLLLWILGLGTLLALLSPQRSGLSQQWILLLRRVFGWGTYFLPPLVGFAGYRALAQEAGRRGPWPWHRWLGLGLGLVSLLALASLAGGRAAGGLVGFVLAQPLVAPLGAWGVAALHLLLAGTGLVLLLGRIPLDRLAGVLGLLAYLGRLPAALPRPGWDLPPLLGPRPPDAPEVQPEIMQTEDPPPLPPGDPSLAAPAVEPGDWQLPDLAQALDPLPPRAEEANLQMKAHIIEDTLHAFGVPARVVRIQQGPVVTLFGVEPGYTEVRGRPRKVRVGKITALQSDLALALSASRIRIQAPVPGYPYVGVEVPNEEASLVSLRAVLESEAFRAHPGPLKLALGMDVSGRAVVGDLNTMPHLLVAGATGSGKSVCINAVISTLLLHHSPRTLKLLLVDPKRVELAPYNGVPHLLASVITNAAQATKALLWVNQEIERRLSGLAQAGARNLAAYNRGAEEPLPYLVIVIDELADLMMTAPEETERLVTRIAQIARATGIHLVMATQRPSVDVVTGLIKANFPARIAFAVASQVDSRVILDQPGAERLLGRGDMLFLPPDAGHPVRLQGPYLSEPEVLRIARFWREQGDGRGSLIPPWLRYPEAREDELLPQAIELARGHRTLSPVALGRMLGVGAQRAERLLEAMEERGVVAPTLEGGNSRRVLEEA